MVLINIPATFDIPDDLKAFPSPCGDYGSYQKEKWLYEHEFDRVSVPLRGLWFLSTSTEKKFKKVLDSFRPLAGIMVLITTSKANECLIQ